MSTNPYGFCDGLTKSAHFLSIKKTYKLAYLHIREIIKFYGIPSIKYES